MEIALVIVVIGVFTGLPLVALASLAASVLRPPAAPTPEDKVLDRRL